MSWGGIVSMGGRDESSYWATCSICGSPIDRELGCCPNAYRPNHGGTKIPEVKRVKSDAKPNKKTS